MRLETITGILFYTVVGVIVYKILQFMLVSELDVNNNEDRELIGDKKTIFICTFLASAIWILYIPYIFISTFKDVIKENR